MRYDHYATTLAQDLEQARANVAAGRVTISRQVNTLVNRCGWSKRSSSNVRIIVDALDRAGVYADVDLSDLRLPWRSKVWLSDTPWPDRKLGRVLVDEASLNRFLRKYHDTVFAAIPELRDVTFVGSEVRRKFHEERRSIDLVFRDPDGTFVAVELERGDPKDDSAMQLRRYMEVLAADGSRVRGVLITARARSARLEEEVLRELQEIEYPTAWYWYDATIDLYRLH